MNKTVLVKTNTVICIVIILGFLLTSLISYNSNNDIFRRDIEHISMLTSEGIYHQIDSIFTKPIHISMTMANDNFLKSFLAQEVQRKDDAEFIKTMREYLNNYKEKYNYDSVFLVSTKTNRYYHFSHGIDRVLTPDNPENVWYYNFLNSPKEYALNVDNDEVAAANNHINVFINCKILAPDGEIMGIVGVGFNVDTLQEMFKNYEESFQLRAFLVNEAGEIELSTNNTGYEKKDLFTDAAFAQHKDIILHNHDRQALWYESDAQKGYIVTQYVPNMEWYLLIDNDFSSLDKQLRQQFYINVSIVFSVIVAVLLVIMSIVHKYNNQIIKLTVEKEKEHRSVFQEETEKLYENIYEINITHNRAASEATEHFFEQLGASRELPYNEALKAISQKQIHESFREGYINTFSVDKVLEAFAEGKECLVFDFMNTTDNGVSFYWMRITARIFFWKDDQSVRMLVYRQNIENEKRREKQLTEKMQRDSLSKLYNKAATQVHISRLLAENPDKLYAFFILDIDNFKNVNDTCGHAFGDLVITDFASKLKHHFRASDIVGRIGGDEFVAFVAVPTREWAVDKASQLAMDLQYAFSNDGKSMNVSSSIGVAVSDAGNVDFATLYEHADIALYKTKKRGKRGYTVYNN